MNSTNAEHTQVLAEYGAGGVLKAKHAYGLGRISTATSSTALNYLTDGQGSVTGILQRSGTLAASFTYDPFGNVTSGRAGELSIEQESKGQSERSI